MASSCDSCRAAPGALRLSSARSGAPAWEAALCHACYRWLSGLLVASRDGAPKLLGAPASDGRELLFDDQCRLCRQITDEPLASIACRTVGGPLALFPSLRLCLPCDTWLAALARDGRSARESAARTVDGPYGKLLHPNLSALSVAVDVADRAARDIILRTCEQAGVPASPWFEAPEPTVLFVELPGHSFRADDNRFERARRVLLATFAARSHLQHNLTSAVTDWLTIPLTPHQVAAALARAALPGLVQRPWDPALTLRLFDPARPLPPGAVLVRPAAGADPAEVAWLLRRHSRGYDELGSLGGEMVLIPRVPAARLEHVLRRLSVLFAGRATFEPFDADRLQPRFDAAG